MQIRHWNRKELPRKHILVCEDDIANQAAITKHFSELFEPQGPVQISFVPGAMAACGVIGSTTVDLILLDHDMPHGNGADLLEWMKTHGRNIPVVTFSGIAENNDKMAALGAAHKYDKNQVIGGHADALIKRILGI